MNDSKRFDELCQRAASRNIQLFSRFLNLAEQKEAEIAARKAGAAYRFFGGAEDCERKMLGVCGDEAPDDSFFPLVCLKAEAKSAKFSSPLEHRAVLGTLMSLGMERELLGDIILRDGAAYIFCTDKMANFICEGLDKIGGTAVRCTISEPPQGPVRNVREVRVQVTSPRLDAIVAHLFKLSRGDAQTLFRQGRIMVDDSVCERTDYMLHEGQVISVRGFGRARYLGVESTSKKGKSNLLIALYA